MSRERYKSNSSMLDLFLLLAMGFVVLFIVAFILIKPVDPKKKDIELEEQMLIKLEWADEATSDIDLWVLLPDGTLVSFKQKENRVASLERDDRGTTSDLIYVDGKEVFHKDNTEIVRIKHLEDGDYYVSVQYYSDAYGHDLEEAFKVTVHDGIAHKDLAIMTGVVHKYAETPVMKITVKDGSIIRYEKSDRFIAVVKRESP